MCFPVLHRAPVQFDMEKTSKGRCLQVGLGDTKLLLEPVPSTGQFSQAYTRHLTADLQNRSVFPLLSWLDVISKELSKLVYKCLCVGMYTCPSQVQKSDLRDKRPLKFTQHRLSLEKYFQCASSLPVNIIWKPFCFGEKHFQNRIVLLLKKYLTLQLFCLVWRELCSVYLLEQLSNLQCLKNHFYANLFMRHRNPKDKFSTAKMMPLGFLI